MTVSLYFNTHIYIFFFFFIYRKENDAETEVPKVPSLEDEIKRLSVVQVSGQMKGLDLIMGKENELRVSNSLLCACEHARADLNL